jgi:hypothetical protein
MHRHFGTGVLLLAMVATAPTGAAAADKVLLLPFAGPSARRVQAKFKEALPPEVAVVPADQASRAAKVFRRRSGGDEQAYAATARKLDATAIVEGTVKRRRGWEVRLSMRSGTTGAVVGSVTWSGARLRNLNANVARSTPQWVSAMREQMQGGDGATPAAEVDMPTSNRAQPQAARSSVPTERELASLDAPDGPSERVAARETSVEASAPDPTSLPVWEISVGPRVVSRSFAYTDNAARLPGYTLAGAAGVAAEASVFPAMGSETFIKYMGLGGSFDTTVSAKTVGSNGAASIDTTLRAYRLGLRYRMPAARSLLITGGFDYGQDQVTINVPDTVPPNVAYGYLRPSVTGKVAIGSRVSLSVAAAYLHVLDLGQMGANQRFPRDSARGAELGAAVGYALDDSFELRLVGDLRRYVHAMNSQAGDRYLVGGAVDEHFGASVLITYRGH